MDHAWVRDLVGQAREADVAVFVKQDAGPRPDQRGRIPDDLWIREWPDRPSLVPTSAGTLF